MRQLDEIYKATCMKTNELNEIVKNGEDWKKHMLGIYQQELKPT